MEIISRNEAIKSGKLYYFTGKPCKKGHIAKRQVTTWGCVKCGLANVAKYRRNNIEKIKARVCEYYVKNAESEKARALAYREKNKEAIEGRRVARIKANPERYTTIQRAYAAKNKERIMEYQKQWDVANPESAKIRNAKYSKLHPEVGKAKNHNRRARKLATGGTFTPDDIKSIMKQQKGKCVVCEVDITNKYHIDHIMPLILGGSNGIENIQLLCPHCNLSKGAKHPDDFMAERMQI